MVRCSHTFGHIVYSESVNFMEPCCKAHLWTFYSSDDSGHNIAADVLGRGVLRGLWEEPLVGHRRGGVSPSAGLQSGKQSSCHMTLGLRSCANQVNALSCLLKMCCTVMSKETQSEWNTEGFGIHLMFELNWIILLLFFLNLSELGAAYLNSTVYCCLITPCFTPGIYTFTVTDYFTW